MSEITSQAAGLPDAAASADRTTDFQVEFIDDSGTRRCVQLAEEFAFPFEHACPIRSFKAWKGQRNNTGWWWCSTTGDHVGFESWLERDHVMLLDFDPAVTGLSSQPFWLHWSHRGKRRTHAPDYFARLADGTGVVIDCRPADRIRERDAEAFTATRHACETAGWRYRLVHDPDRVHTANVRWLSGYRHPRYRRIDLAEALIEIFTEPNPLMRGATACGDPLATLPVIYHLIWRGELTTDLTTPLSPHAVLATAKSHEEP